MKFILGLTGPTGSGKTTLSKAAADLGYTVLDCDIIARKAAEQENTLAALTTAFGQDILEDGILNRKALAKKAFSSTNGTELLNKTMLPFVVELIKKEIENADSEKILLDAPTLYESGADSLCNAVIAVLADCGDRKARIISRDNLTEAEAQLRLTAGKNDNYYKDKTQHIIYNNGDKHAFIKDFKSKIKFLEEK
ncbi:MAG: dephospho-CoA kinase [Clostridia bacterium]|nr:dephospho-CoA kinase [Clostridia bacterium]